MQLPALVLVEVCHRGRVFAGQRGQKLAADLHKRGLVGLGRGLRRWSGLPAYERGHTRQMLERVVLHMSGRRGAVLAKQLRRWVGARPFKRAGLLRFGWKRPYFHLGTNLRLRRHCVLEYLRIDTWRQQRIHLLLLSLVLADADFGPLLDWLLLALRSGGGPVAKGRIATWPTFCLA